MEKAPIAVVGPKDMCIGWRLAGVQVVPATKDTILDGLKRAASLGAKVILVGESIAKSAEEVISSFKSEHPDVTVVVIPDSSRPMLDPRTYYKELARRVTGFAIEV